MKKVLIALMATAIVSVPMTALADGGYYLEEIEDYTEQVLTVAEHEPVTYNIENSPAIGGVNENTPAARSSYGVDLSGNQDNNRHHFANEDQTNQNHPFGNLQPHNNNNQQNNNLANNNNILHNVSPTEHQQIENEPSEAPTIISEHTENQHTHNPRTGAPSLIVPIVTAITSLGAMAVAKRKK